MKKINDVVELSAISNSSLNQQHRYIMLVISKLINGAAFIHS